jgi:hypothetical protein
MAILSDRKGKDNTGDPLAFSDTKQEALLGYAMHDRLFFMQVYGHLQPEWFTRPNNQRLWKALQGFYTNYGRFPQSPVELMNSLELQKEDQGIRNGMTTAFEKCNEAMVSFGADGLIRDFGLWARSVLLEKYVLEATDVFNSRKPEDALLIYKEGYEKIQAAEFIGGGVATDWDLNAFVKQQKSDLENGITFGCPQLDAKLNPSAPGGALLRGDTTVVMAPVNIGKTTALVTVATHNILRGKSVLFITHEGRPEDIKFKVLCCILQVTREEFLALFATDDWFRTKAGYFANIIKKNLEYIAFNRPFATIRDVEALVRQRQDLRRLQDSNHHGFDLLIDDYPALLYTEGLLKGQLQKRISDEQVYGCFVSMALEFGFHALLAIQTNREGSKVNRGQGNTQRLLTMEDVMESWGAMAKATNVLTMNRSPQDMLRNRVTFYLCKSRSSATDWAFCCKSDYSKSTTHAPMGWPHIADGEEFTNKSSSRPDVDFSAYGCTAYAGSDAPTDRLDALIDGYRNSTIPPNILRGVLAGIGSKAMKGSAGVAAPPTPVVQNPETVVQSQATA